MKNNSKARNVLVFGIITLVVLIGFLLIACDNGSSASNPFEGTWTGYDREGDRVRLYVGSTNWTISWVDYYDTYSGTYSRNGNSATLYYQGYNYGSASVSGNALTLYVTDVWFLSGITLNK